MRFAECVLIDMETCVSYTEKSPVKLTVFTVFHSTTFDANYLNDLYLFHPMHCAPVRLMHRSMFRVRVLGANLH